MKLLIVESPAKCKKIQEFLGSEWRVQATMGHIRALKEELEAIGFTATGTPQWKPIYESLSSKKDAIASLRRAATHTEVFLGSDDDREGEAIAWHTCAILGLDPARTPRVVFHEITAPAIRAAVANPRTIDMNKFNAQQARTMLDLLIGFTLSPCLWRGVGFKPGLSAGRCQTPALRLIYDRDREIEGFAASNSWRLSAITEEAIEDSTLEWKAAEPYASEADARAALSHMPPTLTITDRTERMSTSQPPKPFITSSLQQEASSRLNMKPKDTMRAAQKLYEAGHITYMRTDNAILSQEAIEAASAVVTERWGAEYLGITVPKKKVVKKKTDAKSATTPEAQAAHEAVGKPAATASVLGQNAHEGIRPTHLEHMELADVTSQEQRLYDMIWKRTIQSVMAPETRDVVRLTAPPFTTEWSQTRFAGWRMLDAERKEAEEIHAAAVFEARASLVAGVSLDWTSITATEVRSTPTGRYTEASLIRELESRGIGRPSTYATLVETVLDRGYVERATIPAAPVKLGVLTLTPGPKLKASQRTEKIGGEKDKLRTTPLGRTVMEWLLGQFNDMIEYDFTAEMETQLDEVAKGSRPWSSVLTDTWSRYADRYRTIMSQQQAQTQKSQSANKSDFGDGYKMVVSKKGPLFVLEREGEKTRFASVPAHLSLQTATRADAESAFATTIADSLGILNDKPVERRKGPYGHYVVWGDVKVNCTATETLEEIRPRLEAKVGGDTVDHTIGPYKIRKGPYGLYMFKTGTKGKPTFVSIPDATLWSTLTVEGAGELYTHCSTAKTMAKAKK